MTIQKTILNPLHQAAATDALTGNPLAADAAAKSRSILDEISAPAVSVKLRDLPTKKERLLALADMIERAELAKRGIGFNMSKWFVTYEQEGIGKDEFLRIIPDQTQHSCGTVACIAGWTVLSDDQTKRGNIASLAKGMLWLTDTEAKDLFYAGHSTSSGGGADAAMGNISTACAVAVIRDFAESGQVRWGSFNNDGERIK